MGVENLLGEGEGALGTQDSADLFKVADELGIWGHAGRGGLGGQATGEEPLRGQPCG
jgi:hypothetical protein